MDIRLVNLTKVFNDKNSEVRAVDNLNIAPEYDTGSRPIGSNWKSKEQLITNTSNKNVLYQVVLEPSTISKIKDYVNSQDSAYVYTAENYYKDSGPKKFYRSNLIREKFASFFCVTGGVQTNNGGVCNE